MTLPLPAGERTLTLRHGRCRVRVDRLDVDWTPAPTTTWQWQLSGTFDRLRPRAALRRRPVRDAREHVADAARARRAGDLLLQRGLDDLRRAAGRRAARGLAGRALAGHPAPRRARADHRAPARPLRPQGLRRRRARQRRRLRQPLAASRCAPPDQLRFNRFLAREAHARGLSIGLKNDLDQVRELEPHFDWALNEQCFEYRECDRLRPFTAAGKAVFVAEYALAPEAFCPAARAAGFMAMRKPLELGAERSRAGEPVGQRRARPPAEPRGRGRAGPGRSAAPRPRGPARSASAGRARGPARARSSRSPSRCCSSPVARLSPAATKASTASPT